MSCLIILSKCPDLGLYWGSVEVYSGQHVVDIDFQPLGLKSDCKERGFWGLKSLHFHNCTSDAVIWAEQQLVAIPGWLLKYQNARLDQEGQLTSIKRPKSLIIKKNKAKRRTIYCEERGNKMATQAFPSPPPVVT
jgi:hypothetical protein